MKTRILEKLKQIENEKGIEILFAVESGSRAWGFASPDSDYDIRFVFKRNTDFYLSLWEHKDTIEFMTEDDLDGSGWDIKKATLLLAKSNASFLGWLFSPIVYIDNGQTLKAMRELATNNFNPVSGFYHYHSMNKGFSEQLENKDLKLKPFFYAIRTALCANWCLKKGTVPPVEFRSLYELITREEGKLLDDLIDQKSKLAEYGQTSINEKLIDLAWRLINENNERKEKVQSNKPNREDFDQFFLNEIK